MINLDITLFIQVLNFLLGLAIINYLFVRPIRSVIARRRALYHASRTEADSLMEAAEKKLESYNARLAQAQAEAVALKEGIRAEAQKNAQSQIEVAGNEARRILADASERVRKECSQAQDELDAKVGGFAQIALKNMLG